MIDLILIVFFLVVAYASFKAGAKFVTFSAMFKAAVKRVEEALDGK